MTAKVIWKAKNRISGMLPDIASLSTPRRNALSRPPQKALSDGPKAIE